MPINGPGEPPRASAPLSGIYTTAVQKPPKTARFLRRLAQDDVILPRQDKSRQPHAKSVFPDDKIFHALETMRLAGLENGGIFVMFSKRVPS